MQARFLCFELPEGWEVQSTQAAQKKLRKSQRKETVHSRSSLSSQQIIAARKSLQLSQRDLANQTLSFSFEEQGGEWRISEAADGIVLSQTSFALAFREQALYFFDPTYRFLVPDVRWFPFRQTIPARIVRALLAGPTSWLQGGVVRSDCILPLGALEHQPRHVAVDPRALPHSGPPFNGK